MNTDAYQFTHHNSWLNLGRKAVGRMVSLSIGSAALVVLGGCGGGGDNSASSPAGPTEQAPPATSRISGKAIDGYLVGAKVCLDANANDGCDAGEPSAITGSDGSYNLVAEGTVIGKKLLVLIDRNTRDLARPGYTFPAAFTLSTTVDGLQNQHVTPLTTMRASLIEGGKGEDNATRAVVGLVGGTINLKDDYIANGDTSTAAFAAAVVDKVVEIASVGRGDADTVRAVMNAIATKGSITAVTPADVEAARAKPVYLTDVAAADLIQSPLYAVAGLRWDTDPVANIVRETYSILGGAIVKSYDQTNGLGNNGWTVGDKLAQDAAHILGQYSLRADGTWTAFTPQEDVNNNLQIQSAQNNVVQVFDNAIGRFAKLEYRRTDLSNKSFVNGMPAGTDSAILAAMPGAFSTGTPGYAVIQSYVTDTVSMVSTDRCGGTIDPVAPRCTIGTPNKTYSSILEYFQEGNVIPFGPATIGYLNFDAQGNLVSLRSGSNGNAVLLDNSKITVAPYMGRQDIMVFNVKADDVIEAAGKLANNNTLIGMFDQYRTYGDLVKSGAKFGIALKDGKLSWVIVTPAGTEQLTLLNKEQGFNALTSVLKQALVLNAAQ